MQRIFLHVTDTWIVLISLLFMLLTYAWWTDGQLLMVNAFGDIMGLLILVSAVLFLQQAVWRLDWHVELFRPLHGLRACQYRVLAMQVQLAGLWMYQGSYSSDQSICITDDKRRCSA